MFCEVELERKVGVRIPMKKGGVIVPRSYIVTRLLEYLAIEKATKDEGYLISVTRVDWIGQGELMEEEEGKEVMVVFPVGFKCRSFQPLRGEILEGMVHHTCMLGVFLRCGPLRLIFLSARKMPEFRRCGETSSSSSSSRRYYFVHDKLGKIEVGVMLRFVVLDVRWVDNNNHKEFMMLASLVPADSPSSSPGLLGPVCVSAATCNSITHVH